MTNRKRQRRERAKLKAQTLQSSRVGEGLQKLNKENKMSNTYKTQALKDAAIVAAQKVVDSATPANLQEAKDELAEIKAATVE